MGDAARQFGAPLMVAEPGGPVGVQLVQRIERDVDADGWDQPWRLFRIDREHMGEMDALQVAEMAGIPEGARQAHPAEVLPLLCEQTMRAPLDVVRPDKFWGLALALESWMVDAPADDPLAIAEAESWRGRLHEHPRRKELRLVMLVGDGIEANVLHVRGNSPETLTGERAAGWTGRVPDALKALVGAHVLRMFGSAS